jgi:DNA processing protein
VPQNNNNEKNRCSVKKHLEPYPVHIDVLIQKSGLKSSQVISQLLDLELKGVAVRHQGNYYSISEDYH